MMLRPLVGLLLLVVSLAAANAGAAGRKPIAAEPYAPVRPADETPAAAEIEMFVGESRVFPTPGVARIAVGNGQIMSASALEAKEVIIFASGVGTSSLYIWNEQGRHQRLKVNIVPGDTTRLAREIAQFLAAIPHARTAIIGDKVVVEGENLSNADLAKIDELGKRYPQIVNFTNRTGWDQMVLMDVKVVEFPVNELRELGIKWTGAGGAAVGGLWSPAGRGQGAYGLTVTGGPVTQADGSAPITGPAALNVRTMINVGLNAQLNLLSQNGKAAILAEPQLSARNGAKATFLAGGEYPYTVSTINGPTVMFKPYGIKLEIVPRADRSGVIRATIESEVSAIDTATATSAGPGLTTRRTATEFNVRAGETLVLSGLLSRKASTASDQLPLLGDLPLLGALFRSRRFQQDETELVVFVTPTLVDADTPAMVAQVEKARTRWTAELGPSPFMGEGSPPVSARREPLQPKPDADAPTGYAALEAQRPGPEALTQRAGDSVEDLLVAFLRPHGIQVRWAAGRVLTAGQGRMQCPGDPLLCADQLLQGARLKGQYDGGARVLAVPGAGR